MSAAAARPPPPPASAAIAATRATSVERQRGRAERADAAVAHDGEPLVAAAAGGKAVGEIGEPVFVQASGDQHERRDRGDGGQRRRQAEAEDDGEGDRGDKTDQRPGERRRPSEDGKRRSGRLGRGGQGQDREEAQARGEVAPRAGGQARRRGARFRIDRRAELHSAHR